MTLEPALLDLDADLHGTSAAPQPAQAASDASHAAEGPLRDAVDACQRTAIRAALARHDGNWARAARALEVDASNLHKLARRLGLK